MQCHRLPCRYRQAIIAGEYDHHAWLTKCIHLRLPKIDAHHAGMATANHLPGDLRFVREEYVLSFHLSHDVRMLLHYLAMNAFAIDGFIDLDEVWCRALESDERIARPHRFAMAGYPAPVIVFGSLHTQPLIQQGLSR